MAITIISTSKWGNANVDIFDEDEARRYFTDEQPDIDVDKIIARVSRGEEFRYVGPDGCEYIIRESLPFDGVAQRDLRFHSSWKDTPELEAFAATNKVGELL